jgi:hypothetical protein
MSSVLDPDDESLVEGLSSGLAKIAMALEGAVAAEFEPPVSAALEGAELVMRGALVSGQTEYLTSLLPSFVFLVALPVIHQDEALELSRRAEAMIREALGDQAPG